MFSQQGLYAKSDGVVGISPVPLGEDGRDSLVLQLVNNGLISNAMVAFYYSKYPDEKPSSVMFGDLDSSVVEGGEAAIKWFDILEDDDWQVDIT
jgi:hypothetical protein